MNVLQSVVKEAADLFGVSTDEVKGHSRDWQLVCARIAVCYVCREKEFSLKQIGRALGKHHSTVIDNLRPENFMPRLMKQKPENRQKVFQFIQSYGLDIPS